MMEIKKTKTKIPWLSLLGAIGMLVLGVLFIVMNELVVELTLILAIVGILYVYGVIRLIQCFRIGKKLEGVISIVFCWGAASALLFLDYSDKIAALVPSVIVGIVSLLLGIIRIMICINCFANDYRGGVRNLISGILCLAFGGLLTFNPINNFSMLSIVAGCYLIFYSLTMFGDVFASLLHLDMGDNRQRRRVHRVLPNIFSAVLPSNLIKYINKNIKAGNVVSGVLIEEKDQNKFSDPNVEIMVHLTTQGANKFGHVDIAIGDTVYTYGTYDSSTVKYGGFVAQGCFVTVPKVPYLKYCLDYQKKYVIGFGAHMSKKQLYNIYYKIGELMYWCQPLDSEYEKAVAEGRDGSEYNDPASNIVRDLGGKVYTVEKGPFNRYFGINTNCVHVADWLLSDSGIDSIAFSSLSTPGAYYAMLNNMFRRKNTRVIRKTVYIYANDITEESAGLLPVANEPEAENNSTKEQ